MRQAVMVTGISAELIEVQPDGSAIVKVWPDLPPIDWEVRGPRGGRYLATGARTRTVMRDVYDWTANTWVVIDRSEGTKYIRPRAKPETPA